jgi:hypothetical protein
LYPWREDGARAATDLNFCGPPADKFSMFDWKSEYLVNIGSIDAQHQMLFAIGRELYSDMSAGKGKNVLGKILDRLVNTPRCTCA